MSGIVRVFGYKPVWNSPVPSTKKPTSLNERSRIAHSRNTSTSLYGIVIKSAVLMPVLQNFCVESPIECLRQVSRHLACFGRAYLWQLPLWMAPGSSCRSGWRVPCWATRATRTSVHFVGVTSRVFLQIRDACMSSKSAEGTRLLPIFRPWPGR